MVSFILRDSESLATQVLTWLCAIRLLGVPAMADFYTVFDMQNARMGFASQLHLESRHQRDADTRFSSARGGIVKHFMKRQ